MTQEEFWRKEVESRPLKQRLAYIESHFPGSYGCGWEEGIFYPLPDEDAAILQTLWDETYVGLYGKQPGRREGPAPQYRGWFRKDEAISPDQPPNPKSTGIMKRILPWWER